MSAADTVNVSQTNTNDVAQKVENPETEPKPKNTFDRINPFKVAKSLFESKNQPATDTNNDNLNQKEIKNDMNTNINDNQNNENNKTNHNTFGISINKVKEVFSPIEYIDAKANNKDCTIINETKTNNETVCKSLFF